MDRLRPMPLSEAGDGDICFTRSWDKVAPDAVNIGPMDEPPAGIWAIRVEDPRAEMNRILRYKYAVCDVGISLSAVVTEHVEFGEDVYIGSGCVIGEDGFAYDRIDGELKRFPHRGRVIIGNRVEIEANTHVARGSLTDTIIRDGVKIDANCHVGHNCYIGEDTMLTAGSILGGSVHIGKRVWVGLNSTIRDGVTIGDDACIGMGAVVVKDVPSGVTVIGNPAKEMS